MGNCLSRMLITGALLSGLTSSGQECFHDVGCDFGYHCVDDICQRIGHVGDTNTYHAATDLLASSRHLLNDDSTLDDLPNILTYQSDQLGSVTPGNHETLVKGSEIYCNLRGKLILEHDLKVLVTNDEKPKNPGYITFKTLGSQTVRQGTGEYITRTGLQMHQKCEAQPKTTIKIV